MSATMNMRKRAAVLLTAVGLMISLGAGAALASNLVGDNGRDRLVGTPENDRLVGRGGIDKLFGLGDSDRLYGSAGPDRLVGGDDSDLMVGGAGNDVIDANEPGRLDGDRINCGPGRDRVINALPTEDIIRANCEIVRR